MIYRCSFSLETEHRIELCAWSDNVCHPGILETDTLMLTDRRSVIRPTLTQTVITVFSHWVWTTSCGFVQYFTSITLIFNGEKEFEKHFSFRLNKFLNFSDICFSHHSALHTDPDKINTFHLVGETEPSGNRGLGRGKYFNIILKSISRVSANTVLVHTH